MGVRALWQCDRDGKMFTSKKDADAYDKMLELAEAISTILEQNIDDLSDKQAENVGRVIAENKDIFANAFKGKVDDLQQIIKPEEDTENNVAQLNAAK
ncbi:YebG family protein [Algibacillus agarilyticus]|uniref:YebG family protein n=1 Tax=Algibacillus agarilyticus TaxID=2234133 RepID=UPI000DCFACE4|nr:YebG family protein [Algibacillus agarilyticus]